MSIPRFALWVTLALPLLLVDAIVASGATKPNVVIVFADDLGYGDLGCYGSQTIDTPRLDAMARAGTRFTSFYVQPVCGPSRAALLTGRYPIRSGGWDVPGREVMLGELFQQAGYATCCIGKWDNSRRKPIIEQMPRAQGFDYFWGPLGSNDRGRITIYENNDEGETITDMASLSRRYTDKAIDFIDVHKDEPFFLYIAHTMVHTMVDASPEFKGKSRGGLYGDAVEELDFQTGRLLDALAERGLTDNTIVLFLSDNGPWNNHQEALRKANHGQIAWGSSGPLREGKGSTFEGGFRVPCIAWWPSHVPAERTSDAIFASLDFVPTFATIAGYTVPHDRPIDGVDQSNLLLGKSESGARESFYFIEPRDIGGKITDELHAVRKGKWKLFLPHRKHFIGYVRDRGSKQAELYDLDADIGEQHNLAAEHPKIVEELLSEAKAFSADAFAPAKEE